MTAGGGRCCDALSPYPRRSRDHRGDWAGTAVTGSRDADPPSRFSLPPRSPTRSQSSPDDRTAEVRIPPSSRKADAQSAPHGETHRAAPAHQHRNVPPGQPHDGQAKPSDAVVGECKPRGLHASTQPGRPRQTGGAPAASSRSSGPTAQWATAGGPRRHRWRRKLQRAPISAPTRPRHAPAHGLVVARISFRRVHRIVGLDQGPLSRISARGSRF